MVLPPEQEYKLIKGDIKANRFLSTKENNNLLLEFLEAKRNGGYGRIVYKIICDYGTLVKKARNLAKIDQYFKKNFTDISEEEILKYRDLLNENKIYCDKTLISWSGGKSSFKIVPTKNPLSYRTKKDYSINFKEFFQFIIELKFQKEKTELKDITKFFKIRSPPDYNEIIVEFIPDDDLTALLNNIKNRNFKALVQLSLMSGARPCEIINVRYGKKHNLYKNKEGKWIIHLPKIKKISYKKFPFIVDMYEDELCPYFNNLKKKEGDLVFHISEATFRALMLHYTEKYIGKRYSPKILRKTARMLRTNAGYSEMWINKLLGHAPGNKVQGHYVNYEGIKNEDEANERLKAQQYPSLKKEYQTLKLELQAANEKIKDLQQQLPTIFEFKTEIDRMIEKRAKQLNKSVEDFRKKLRAKIER